MRHGEAGQGSAEYAGLLAVVALVVAAVTAGGMGGAIADGAERKVCAIVEAGAPAAPNRSGTPGSLRLGAGRSQVQNPVSPT
jgi:hypothetical protein